MALVSLEDHYKQIESSKTDVQARYESALDRIKNSSLGSNSQNIEALNQSLALMPEEDAIAAREAQLKKDRNEKIEQAYGGRMPMADDVLHAHVVKWGKDRLLGAEEIYREKMDEWNPSIDNASALATFREKQAKENASFFETDPAAYDYGDKDQYGIAKPINKFMEFVGDNGPTAAAAYAFGKTVGPYLGLAGGWGTGLSATKEIPKAAVNAFAKNVGMDVAFDSINGALDQNANAAGSAKMGLLTNLLLRPVTYGLQRIPDINNDEIRKVIDTAEAMQKQYGDNFSIAKPSTWWKEGNDLHLGIETRARTPSLGAQYNARLRAPGTRDIYDEFEGDKSGFLAKLIKRSLLPGSEGVDSNMAQTIDKDFLETFSQVAKKSMNATPTKNIALDMKEYDNVINGLKDKYGDAIRGVPVVKKYASSIESMADKHAIIDPITKEVINGTEIMTPEYFSAKINEIDESIRNTSFGTDKRNALEEMREWLYDQAVKQDPDFAEVTKSGRTQWAGYKRLLKITDPFTGMIDRTKASKARAEDIANHLPGIPLTYDLNGVQRNLFNDVGDVSWLTNPKNFSSATLHDNQEAAAGAAADATLGKWQNFKLGGLQKITGIGNAFDDDLGSIPVRFYAKDFGYGFSPTQLNAFRSIIGAPIVESFNSKEGVPAIYENEKQMANSYHELLKRRNRLGHELQDLREKKNAK